MAVNLGSHCHVLHVDVFHYRTVTIIVSGAQHPAAYGPAASACVCPTIPAKRQAVIVRQGARVLEIVKVREGRLTIAGRTGARVAVVEVNGLCCICWQRANLYPEHCELSV